MSLADWRRRKIKEAQITSFYYLAPIENASDIVQHGILSKNQIEKKRLKPVTFAEQSVQNRRRQKQVILSDKSRRNIHDLVPVYLTPKTPTLYARRDWQENLYFIQIDAEVICDEKIQFCFTDGNAASEETQFYRDLSFLNRLPWDVLRADYWTQFADGKRKRNSEFLIYPSIPNQYFRCFGVINQQAAEKLQKVLSSARDRWPVEIKPDWFF